LRLTEQGEVIGQKYNTPETAAANLESLVASTFGARLLAEDRAESKQIVGILDRLSLKSQKRYRSLIEADGFISFYRQATPIDAIEQSRIGSRPSRRTGQATLDDLRAIPWVFSWNQSRFYLTGWYGVGTALASLQEDDSDDFEQLKQSVRPTPFLRYFFYNVESSIASADLEWMQAYGGLVQDKSLRKRFMDMILEERELTLKGLEQLFQHPLEERRPRFWKTMKEREPALNHLHTAQIEALKVFRKTDKPAQETIEQLLLLINAIASGLRTTG
ncbi:MAG: phosphoenolpyruvate carboxylase, partial [Verrucomicrobiota bacterium]